MTATPLPDAAAATGGRYPPTGSTPAVCQSLTVIGTLTDRVPYRLIHG